MSVPAAALVKQRVHHMVHHLALQRLLLTAKSALREAPTLAHVFVTVLHGHTSIM